MRAVPRAEALWKWRWLADLPDASTQPVTERKKLRINPFISNILLLFGLTEPSVNLPKTETSKEKGWKE